MEGKFLQVASKNFVKLTGSLKKNLDGAVSEHTELLKSKARDKANNTKNKALDPNRITKDVCSVNNKELNRRIKKIISRLKAVLRIIKSILKNVEKLKKFVRTLQKITIAFKVVVKILKKLPIPNRWTTAGMTTSLSSTLDKIDKKLSGFLFLITGVDVVLSILKLSLKSLSALINVFLSKLKALSNELKNCKTDYSPLYNELDTTIGEVEAENQLLISELGLNEDATIPVYRGYTFEIIEEEVVDKSIKIKRRYAVAKNSNGIVEFTGEATYATDTQVLIDELKLRIDEEFEANSNAMPYGLDTDTEDDEDNIIDETYEEFDLPSDEELNEEENEAMAAIEEMKLENEKAIEESLNKKDKRFIKGLRRWESKYNDVKAKELLNGIFKSQTLTVTKAKKQWKAYLVANLKKFRNRLSLSSIIKLR